MDGKKILGGAVFKKTYRYKNLLGTLVLGGGGCVDVQQHFVTLI